MRSKVKDRIILRGGTASGANFLPSAISNLKLWLDASTDAITDGAAQFTAANSEYLSRASNSTLQTGAVDFWFAGWVYMDTVDTRMDICYKYSTGQYEFGVVRESTNRFTFDIFDGAGVGSTVIATTFGAVTSGVWYFVLCYRDSVNSTINISVNGGAFNSAADRTMVTSTAPFNLGSFDNGAGQFWNGRQDSCAFGKSPPGGIAGIISALSTALYNSGVGKTYADLTTAQKTDWGLISWWDLDEQSGTRNDSHGTNHLTDNNTVTSAIGIVAGIAGDGDPISKWTDRSGNGYHALQTTAAKRPTYKTAIQNGKPIIRFDGVDDFLQTIAFATQTGLTLFVVAARPWTVKNGLIKSMFGKGDIDSASAGVAMLSNLPNGADWIVGDFFMMGDGYDVASLPRAVGPGPSLSDNAFVAVTATLSASLARIFINTVRASTRVESTAAVPLETEEAYIGAYQYQGAGVVQYFWNGDIAEVILYDSALSDAQRAQVEAYLNTKYAIY